MPHESPLSNPDIYDIETLSPQSRMARLLEVFDLGEDKAMNAARKQKFLELMEKYYEAVVKSRVNSQNEVSSSNAERAGIHNQIMETIQNISLSLGITPSQRRLAEYLAADRKEVERMISSYFTNYDITNPREQSELHQALRGNERFAAPPEWE